MNFSRHFPIGSVDEIVVNNPQSTFLTQIYSSLKSGATVTVRGQKANRFFQDVYDEVAEGIDGFEIISKRDGLSKEGFFRTDGSALRGDLNSVNEITLKKL
ncbi:hypothetical protein [Lewinella sp. LCG006]|uniref:hypothetical protein n=1 Tax=Lewinella sp. LCG006 TaxID=3231911 RepID=UPI00345F3627